MSLYQETYTFYHDPDDDYEVTQPRCEQCGGFLPWKPNGESHVKVGQQDEQTYDNEGNELTYTLISESWQPVMGWECKRCGNFQGEFDSGPEKTITYDPPKVGDWRPVEGKPGMKQVVWR